MFSSITLLGALSAGTALAGNVMWDGRFNDLKSSAELSQWSWSNEVGPYQYYIHGSAAVTEYVSLSASNKNPADTSSQQGAKFTIDKTSLWNGQTMLRTELIPQTTAPVNVGKVYYHFSMSHTGTNAPSPDEEHQVCFFESHFTEMKYGLIDGEPGTSDTNLRWEVGGVSKWNVTFAAGVWHNIAYAIDFDAETVEFYHSTGSDALKSTAGPFPATTSSNGADWHLGVLRLPAASGQTDSSAEDWLFSGVYIENGTMTTSVSGPEDASGSSAAANATGLSSSVAAAVTAVPTTLQTSVVFSFSQAASSSSVAELPTTAAPEAYGATEATSASAITSPASIAELPTGAYSVISAASNAPAITSVTVLASTDLSIFGGSSEATSSYIQEATAVTSSNTIVLSSGTVISTVGVANTTAPLPTSTVSATSALTVTSVAAPTQTVSSAPSLSVTPYIPLTTASASSTSSAPATSAASPPASSTPAAPVTPEYPAYRYPPFRPHHRFQGDLPFPAFPPFPKPSDDCEVQYIRI